MAGGEDRAAGARDRRDAAGGGDRRRPAAGAHQRPVHRAGRERAERAARQRRAAGRRVLHAAVERGGGGQGRPAPRRRRAGVAGAAGGRRAGRRRRGAAGAAARRREPGVHRAEGLEGARGVREGAVHRQLRQLPRRDQRAGRPDPAGPLVPRVVGRQRARVGLARGRGQRGAAGDGAAAPDAGDRRRAARRRAAACRRRSTCRGRRSRRCSAPPSPRCRRPPRAAMRGPRRRRRAAGGARCRRRCVAAPPAAAERRAGAGGVRRAAVRRRRGAVSRSTSCRTPRPRSSTDRIAHLPWLQEMPDPLTSAMWSSWVEINPATAAKLGIGDGDIVDVTSAHGTLRSPAVITPGIAPDIVAMPMGQGHTKFTRYATGRGENPAQLLAPLTEPATGALAWAATRVKRGAGRRSRRPPGAVCRRQRVEEGHEPARSTADAALGNGGRSRPLHRLRRVRHRLPRREQHLDGRALPGDARPRQALDSRRALLGGRVPGRQAEVPPGDVPAVRQRAVRAGVPDLRQPAHRRRPERAGLQPLHRHALLRQRLPVQRALLRLLQPGVGQAAAPAAQSRRVAARSRRDGEVHLLRAAHQGGEDPGQGRETPLKDGEIKPACAQSCPAKALVFGDLDDPESAVSRLSESPRGSKLLEDLGTQPEVTYLSRQTQVMSAAGRPTGQINSDLLRPLLHTSWRFYLLVLVFGGIVARRPSAPGSTRSTTASASPASAGRSSGASTSPTSCSGSASATPAR